MAESRSTEAEDEPEPDRDLSPTQRLILEVLAARHRLGEACWHFENRLRPALDALGDRGLVWFKDASVPGQQRAWLTEKGRAVAMSATYRPAKPAGLVVGIGHSHVPPGHAEVRLWVPTSKVQDYIDRLSPDPWKEISNG